MRLGASPEYALTTQGSSIVFKLHSCGSGLVQQHRYTHVRNDQSAVSELQRPRRPSQVTHTAESRQVTRSTGITHRHLLSGVVNGVTLADNCLKLVNSLGTCVRQTRSPTAVMGAKSGCKHGSRCTRIMAYSRGYQSGQSTLTGLQSSALEKQPGITQKPIPAY